LAAGTAFPGLSLFALPENGIWIVSLSIFKDGHCFLEILFSKFTAIIDTKEDPGSTCREKVMLKWRRSEIGVDNMTWLRVDFSNPLSELECIRDGSGKEHVMYFIREQNDGFFPYNTTFYSKYVDRFRIPLSLI
jgi:hypothetical protein